MLLIFFVAVSVALTGAVSRTLGRRFNQRNYIYAVMWCALVVPFALILGGITDWIRIALTPPPAEMNDAWPFAIILPMLAMLSLPFNLIASAILIPRK